MSFPPGLCLLPATSRLELILNGSKNEPMAKASLNKGTVRTEMKTKQGKYKPGN